jgi:hydroxymethylglutaryl-CoA reductase
MVHIARNKKEGRRKKPINVQLIGKIQKIQTNYVKMTDSTTSHFKDIKIEHNLNEYFLILTFTFF